MRQHGGGGPAQETYVMRASRRTVRLARRLRREMTLPEVLLWTALRRDAIGLRFRRQHPAGPFVLDFYCPAARLAVEVDGATHDVAEQAARDERRTVWLTEQGIRVLRIAAADILREDGVEAALLMIRETAAAPSTADAVPLPRCAGED